MELINMKKFLLASVVIMSASTAGLAADLAPPAPVVYDWTGGYFGLNAGAAWNNSSVDRNVYDLGGPITALGDSLDSNQTVFTGGMEAGYNWQMDSLVMGLETDFNYLGFGDDFTRDVGGIAGLPLGTTARLSVDANWFGTVRGRLGFAADNMLFYGTGGLAYGNVKAAGSITLPGGASWSADESNVNWGWTVGAGMEYAFDQNWVLGAEYLYVDLGSNDWNYVRNGSLPVGVNARGSVNEAFSVVRAKVDFKF
jgi:outer membrane immunogenic protein